MANTYFQKSNPGLPKPVERQKLTRKSDSHWLEGENQIKTIVDLRKYLAIAIQIELATIPPYLCALYSIREGTNPLAAGIIQSVVMEEMLHLIMASNLLNAVDGKPDIPKAMLKYPGPLPKFKDKFDLRLLRFSKEAIDIFLKIEKPAKTPFAPAVDTVFESIGQFYAAIHDAIKDLEAKAKKKDGTIFTGDPALQIGPEQYYGGGGTLIAVHSLQTAYDAIDEIVGQGEGIDGTIVDADEAPFGEGIELAHYFRFNEIACGRKYAKDDSAKNPPSGSHFDVDWSAVYNIKGDATIDDYSGNSELLEKANEFNLAYTSLLKIIDRACKGEQKALMEEGIPIMIQLKYKAIELMKTPIGNGDLTAAPTFEYAEKTNKPK